jgi:3-oxoacyl-[acyl-carrier protein] reductase
VDFGIKGKLALVTASSGGMGRNIAHALAAEGANVVLFARSPDKLQEVQAEIEKTHGVKVISVVGSLLDAAGIQKLAGVLAQHSGPDIAVVVTGRPPNPLRDAVDETDLQRWDEAYQVQLRSVVQIVNGVVPQMVVKGWGRVVAVTSASAKQPMGKHALSTVFRAGVTAYMKTLANELGPNGVTVNCVAPALIDTSHRTGAAAYTPDQTARRKAMTPLGRMGTQDELCGVIAFLCSAQAGFVTGSTVTVDGGMVASLF